MHSKSVLLASCLWLMFFIGSGATCHGFSLTAEPGFPGSSGVATMFAQAATGQPAAAPPVVSQPATPAPNAQQAVPSQTTGPTGSTVVPPPVSQPAAPFRNAAPRASGMISLNFDDADIYSVAQTVFGEILRVNYIIDQRVKGRVTFRSVAPVSTDQVLPLMEVILRLNGVGVVEENSLYRLVPISDVAKEPAQVSIGRDPGKIAIQGKSIIHIIPVSYGSSTDMVKIMTPFLTASAVAVDVPATNHIIIVDTDANVRRIVNLIRIFDSEETRTRKPQVYVYHIQNSKAKDIAALLQQAFSTTTVVMPAATTTTTGTTTSTTSPMQPQPQTTRPATPTASTQPSTAAGSAGSLVSPLTKIIADEGLNLLLILALPEDYELIKEAIQRVDIIPRQVVIEGVIAEVSLKDDLSLGISWALQLHKGGMGGVLGSVEGLVGFNMPGASVSNPPAITDVNEGMFSFAGMVGRDFKAIINTLATQSKAKLLAVPHILVSDNKEARIQVGQQVPIVTSESYTTQTGTAYSTVQYKDIGIILKVKPRINEGGLVSLDLAQEVSSYSVEKVTAENEGIVLSKTEATTNLVVQNGQTIVIGGLIREDVSDGRAGIPLLSKIPILGYLFGNTDKTNHRNELIILLTPRVIRNQAEAQSITSGYVDTITNTGKGKITQEELLRGQKIVPDQGPSVNNNNK